MEVKQIFQFIMLVYIPVFVYLKAALYTRFYYGEDQLLGD